MKKIIISSVVVALILIVGVTTIILAVVPTGINNVIASPNEITIMCSKTKDYSAHALVYRDREDTDKATISNIYSLFSHAFEQKTLNAILNGELHSSITENYISKGSKYIKNNSNEENKMTICFRYLSKKNIMEEEYNYIYFEITNTDERQECVFGIGKTFSASDEYFYYNYYYSGKANFKNLFNYIDNLI